MHVQVVILSPENDKKFLEQFVLSFENENNRTSFSKYYVANVQMKDFNVLIEGKSFFEIRIKNGGEIYEQIIKMR